MKAYLDPNTQAFIRYFDFPGDEPTLVFLAGLGLASTAIYPRVMVEPCLLGRRSILVDLFGSGYSDRPEQYSYSLEEHATTFFGFLVRYNGRLIALQKGGRHQFFDLSYSKRFGYDAVGSGFQIFAL